MNETFDLCLDTEIIIPLSAVFIGSLAALEEANLLLTDSNDSLQISFSLDVKQFNIHVNKDDIKSIKEDYSQGQIEIILKPSAVMKINEHLQDTGNSILINDTSKHLIAINLNDPYAHQIKRLQSFFSSVKPDVDIEEKSEEIQMITDIEMKDLSCIEVVETTKGGRKKKCESENQEPVKKKPRNTTFQEASTDGPSRRQLRSRKGITNYTDEPIQIVDKKKDSFELDLEIAIKESLKTANLNESTINLIDSPDEKTKKKKKKKNSEPEIDLYAHIDKTAELLHYPSTHHVFEPFAGEVIVKMEDFLCLGKAEYLSDVIIDFYLNYIYREKFTDELRDKVYIFPSQLYSLYSTNASFAGWTSEENVGKSAPQKRYERIQGMLDASVNIFEKEFLVFPLFQNEHWFLAIVCYPILKQSVSFEGNSPVENDTRRNVRKMMDPDYNPIPLKTSCILTFDSVKSNSSRRSAAMIHIRHFLKSHWEKNYKGQFELGELISCSVPSPSQSNNVDCGCFLLEFVERFFLTDPMKDFRLPIFKKDWFDSEQVRVKKRREIVEVVRQKMHEMEEKNNFTTTIELPELHFYSEHLAIDIVDNGEPTTNENENHLENYGNNNEELNINNNNDLNCLDNNGAEIPTITQNPPCSPILFETEEITLADEQNNNDNDDGHDEADDVEDPLKVSYKKSYLCIHEVFENHSILKEDSSKDEKMLQENPGISEIATTKLFLKNFESDKKSINEAIEKVDEEESRPFEHVIPIIIHSDKYGADESCADKTAVEEIILVNTEPEISSDD